MRGLKIALLVIGCLAVLLGLVWIGQGTGYFPYPRNSFMISERPWADRGAVVLAGGVIAVVASWFWPARG